MAGVITPKYLRRKEAAMYLDFTVKIPDAKNKITYRRKGDVDYVYTQTHFSGPDGELFPACE